MNADKLDCSGTKEDNNCMTHSDTSSAACLDNRVSLSVASGPQASSGAEEVSADEICNTNKDNAVACNNGSKHHVFQCFEKTYQRSRLKVHGENRKSKRVDGLFLLASAAAAAKEPLLVDKASSSSEVSDDCLSEMGATVAAASKSTPVLNLHDTLNFRVMEKLKSFLNTQGCGLASGWKVRHKTCRCSGTHLYISPEGVKFSSMSAVLNHVRELKGDDPSIDFACDPQKPRGLNRMSSVSACPHASLLVDEIGLGAFAKRHPGRDKMERDLSQESNAQTIISRETTGSVEYGMVDKKLNASSLLSQQEQSEALGHLKPYCNKCEEDLDADNFLICDGCEAAHHVHCVTTDITDVPSGSWYCATCTARGRVSSPEPNSTNNLASAEDDQCVMCEGIHFPTIYETYVPVKHHCVVCERLYEHRQMQHHCVVCERLYNLAREHIQLQAERKRNGVPIGNKESLLRQIVQKSWACRVCQTGDKNDEGMAKCANEGCFSRYYHISCLKPPLREVPPPGWYCPSCLCRACLVNENDDRIVLCDGCDDGYHTYCMKPSLLRIPRGNWYCCSCRDKRSQSVNIQQLQSSGSQRAASGHGRGNLKKVRKKRKVLPSSSKTGKEQESKGERPVHEL